MLYEVIKWKKLGDIKDPKCILCKKKVNFSDYYLLCKKEGKKYYAIPKMLRILLPKFIIKLIYFK